MQVLARLQVHLPLVPPTVVLRLALVLLLVRLLVLILVQLLVVLLVQLLVLLLPVLLLVPLPLLLALSQVPLPELKQVPLPPVPLPLVQLLGQLLVLRQGLVLAPLEVQGQQQAGLQVGPLAQLVEQGSSGPDRVHDHLLTSNILMLC